MLRRQFVQGVLATATVGCSLNRGNHLGGIDSARGRPSSLGWVELPALNQALHGWPGSWLARDSDVPMGAGPSRWSQWNVVLHSSGEVGLALNRDEAGWVGAELRSRLPSPYGECVVELAGPLGALDPRVVLGAFLYSSDRNELDVELATWGQRSGPNGQFAVAHNAPARVRSFYLPESVRSVVIVFRWGPSELSIAFEGGPVHSMLRLRGPRKLAPARHSLHLNLWSLGGRGPTNAQPVEALVRRVAWHAL